MRILFAISSGGVRLGSSTSIGSSVASLVFSTSMWSAVAPLPLPVVGVASARIHGAVDSAMTHGAVADDPAGMAVIERAALAVVLLKGLRVWVVVCVLVVVCVAVACVLWCVGCVL